MKLVFYIFIFSQLLNYISVFADKFKTDSSGSNSINWEKVQENKSNKLKNIIWKSYNNDDSYFKNKNYKVPNLKNIENREANKTNVQEQKNSNLTQIDSFIPLNNFQESGDFRTEVKWKSTFDGGK